jgi:hypothetical protein
MTGNISSIICKYWRQIARLPRVPASSYGVESLRNSLAAFLVRTDPQRNQPAGKRNCVTRKAYFQALASFHTTVVQHLPSHHVRLVRLLFRVTNVRGRNCLEVHSPLHQTRQRQSTVPPFAGNRYHGLYRPPRTQRHLSSAPRACTMTALSRPCLQVATEGITL